MIEIQAPNEISRGTEPSIFLAGSIEMGAAAPWQDAVIKRLHDLPVVILNPRRKDWDSGWSQRKDEPEFHRQVTWELDALSACDYIALYLDPETRSPISLLELGLCAQSGKLFVVCPEGFYRKGNVDIVCEKYGVPQFATLDLLVEHLRTLILGR